MCAQRPLHGAIVANVIAELLSAVMKDDLSRRKVKKHRENKQSGSEILHIHEISCDNIRTNHDILNVCFHM
jgi:hypothetical protein